MSNYEGHWPVELYVKIIIGKRIACNRHRFKMAVESLRRSKQSKVSPVKISTPAVCQYNILPPSVCTHHLHQREAEISSPSPPPPYQDPATGNENDFDPNVHPDAVPDAVEDFLKSCDFDLGHLTGVFITPRAGLFNLERLESVASWPAALRRDHLERRFGTMLDDVEIEALNKRFTEIDHARRL